MTRPLARRALDDADWNALDDIEFLARSLSRLHLLEALATAPCDRRELQEATGVSRATVGRVVTDFEERGWASRHGRRYELSPLGSVLGGQFCSFLGAVSPTRASPALGRSPVPFRAVLLSSSRSTRSGFPRVLRPQYRRRR